MKKLIILGFLGVCCTYNSVSQTTISYFGIVMDKDQKMPLKGVTVTLKNTRVFTTTNDLGEFQLDAIFNGANILEFQLEGYESTSLRMQRNRSDRDDLGIIYLKLSKHDVDETLLDLISLKEEPENTDFIAGLFHSSKDAYQRAAAFNFGQVWFKVRGYDSSYGKILINGIEMNKHYDNRVQWSNWGGLNEVFRNQQFSYGTGLNDRSFGGLLGTTNFMIKSSNYRPGISLTYSSTNKSYKNRLMGTYISGFNSKNWALAVSGSVRFAEEGFAEGTPYLAWSGFLSLEKKINEYHSLNLTGIAASNRRGKASPNTQEVIDLKGITYNGYWGMQEGKIRNSRIKEIFEPLLLISHFYKKPKLEISSSIAYQFGFIGNSRLGHFKVKNPDPTYYKYLPSYFLGNPDQSDYSSAYLAMNNFLENGQVNWKELYQLNRKDAAAFNYLYEDRNDNTQFSGNMVLRATLKDQLYLTLGGNYSKTKSVNYAKMLDLLGGGKFIDLNAFGQGKALQQDLLNPNRAIDVGEKFQYAFDQHSKSSGLFLQLESRGRKIEFFGSAQLKTMSYQRKGHYKNGSYEASSYGKSEQVSFSDISIKGGVTYKLTGRHVLYVNGAILGNAPRQKVVFSNARVSNMVTPNMESEVIQTVDVNYLLRLSKLQARITGYLTQFLDQSRSSFYFAQGLYGDQAHFVNETITDISKRHSGIEWSVDYQFLPEVKLVLAGSIGKFQYSNNPSLTLRSENLLESNIDFGNTYLKNYKVSGTPQRGYSLGLEYRDPNYWWLQINGNYLSHHFIDIAPILRTKNFYLDSDGIPFVNPETKEQVKQKELEDLLKQEQFDSVFLLNIIGGKSWRINSTYIGLFLGVNNALGTLFKTGGFEQSRKANYLEYKNDKSREKPVFGPKYWYGNKASYFLNVSVKF